MPEFDLDAALACGPPEFPEEMLQAYLAPSNNVGRVKLYGKDLRRESSGRLTAMIYTGQGNRRRRWHGFAVWNPEHHTWERL